MNDTVYAVWLSLAIAPGGGYDGLFTHFATPEELWRASREELVREGFTARLTGNLCRKDLREAGRIAEYCEKNGVRILIRGREGYPGILGEIQTPPYLLYVLGSLPDLDTRLGIGVVGTRNMTPYGMENAYRISYELASAGAVIVSGMARGIDGTAACGALEAGGQTVAVIGCGPDTAYPAEHGALMREIASAGAVISEYCPGSAPSSDHFPIRNRIISGLSRGLFVVEAGRKSGAMLTADQAKNEKRDIFALPGRGGDAMSEGPNALLRSGARPVFGAEDILDGYVGAYPLNTDGYARSTVCSGFRTEVLRRRGVRLSQESTQTAEAAAAALSPGRSDRPEDPALREFFEKIPPRKPVSADWFLPLGYRAEEAISMLTLLEITGFVRSIPGGMYTR